MPFNFLFFAPMKVYPIGIPALYGTILWRKREFLNPIRPTKAKPQSTADGTDGRASRVDSSGEEDGGAFWSVRGASENEKQAENESEMSPKEFHEYMERVRERGENPELTPFVFLWKDFGKNWMRIPRPVTRVCVREFG